VRVQRAEDPLEAEGSTRAPSSPRPRGLRDRINEAHMLAGVTIVDPASTWIDAGVEIEPDVDDPPVHASSAASVAIASGVEIGPFAVDPPRHAARRDAKVGTFVELKKRSVGARTKIPHLSYIGDAEIGEDTNVAAGNVTANFSHARASRRSGRRSAATSGPGSTIRSSHRRGGGRHMDCARDGHHGECAPGSLAGFAPRQVTKEGWVYEKHGKPTATELALPGLEGSLVTTDPSPDHFIVRGR
jgi:bifunctional UDP-N-acetylglucosamine pyrophosphorylase/glucosamine-1-phosphate N-acetyltransferase